MPLLWNPFLHPPGGYLFTDADRVEHSSGSLEALMSKVAEYRFRRGLPPGNPAAEIQEQLCERFPDSCTEGALAQMVTPILQSDLASRLAAWLRFTWNNIARRQVGFEKDEVVLARVAICAKCPEQRAMPGACPACLDSLNQISYQLRAGRDKHSAQLHACNYAGSDTRVDVLLEQPQDAKAPSNCWKRA